MKKYLFIVGLLGLFSSCLKIENVRLCDTPPAKPVLSGSSFTLNTTDTLKVSVVSPDTAAYIYTWIPPSGSQLTGSKLSYFTYNYNQAIGAWHAVARSKSNLCVSDSAAFTVHYNVQLPSCGMADNSVKVTSSTVQNVPFFSSTQYSTYYKISFYKSSGCRVNFYFGGTKPTADGIYTAVNSLDYIDNGNCYVEYIDYNSGYTYVTSNSNSKYIYTDVNGSIITIAFCGLTFYDNNYYNYDYNCNARFVTN